MYNLDLFTAKISEDILSEGKTPCILGGQLQRYDEEGNQTQSGKQICVKVKDLPAEEKAAYDLLKSYMEAQLNA